MLLAVGSDIKTTVDDIASLLQNVSLPYYLETLESFVLADYMILTQSFKTPSIKTIISKRSN